MKKIFALLLVLGAAFSAAAQTLPTKFDVKIRTKFHVQGMAIDTTARCFYLSFTTSLVKTDYEGNVLAQIDSIPGHLGCMTFDPSTRRLYASLEYKDDEIGRGIAASLKSADYTEGGSTFYIAVFDVDRIEEGVGKAMQEFNAGGTQEGQ